MRLSYDRVWFKEAGNLANAVGLYAAQIDPVTTARVADRWYAGGRVRQVSQPGTQQALALTFDLVPRLEVLRLEAWTGVLLWYLDPLGRRLLGSYASLRAPIAPGPLDVSTVSLTFTGKTRT